MSWFLFIIKMLAFKRYANYNGCSLGGINDKGG